MFRNPVHQALMVLTGAILAASFVAGSLLHKESAPVAGAAPNPIRLAFQDNIDNALCIIAVEKNYFQAAGVPVAALRQENESTAEALLSGTADVAALDDSKAIIAASRKLPLTIIAGNGRSNPLLLLASNRILQQRPEMIKGLLVALQQAETFIRENPAESAAILSEITGLPTEQVQKSMALHEYRLRLDEPVITSLENTAEVLRRQGVIDRPPDLRRMADAGYLP